MNEMRHTIVPLLLLVLATGPLFSQNEIDGTEEFSIGQAMLGLDFLLTFPQGEFRENSDDVGYGLGFDLGYVIPRMPAVIGLTGSFATYGSQTYNVPFSGTVQLVRVDLTTSNNIATGHLFLRMQPQDGVFRPYFEGLLGFHYFWTESRVEDERYEDKEIAGSTNLSDIAFSYGAGGGVQFLVYRGASSSPGQGVEVLVDLKARFLYGGNAKYFDEKSITLNDDDIPVLLEEHALLSETDMLQTMIGVSVRF